MSYYSDEPLPQPTPQPEPSPQPKQPSLAAIALIVAVAGLFLPVGADGWKLPIPTPPFVEPVIDATKTEGSWVVIVEQTEDRSLQTAELMRDLPYWQSLKARGLKYRHYDYDSDNAAPYRAKADSIGMPAGLILGGQGELEGKLLAEFPVTDKPTLDAKIKEVTGR